MERTVAFTPRSQTGARDDKVQLVPPQSCTRLVRPYVTRARAASYRAKVTEPAGTVRAVGASQPLSVRSSEAA